MKNFILGIAVGMVGTIAYLSSDSCDKEKLSHLGDKANQLMDKAKRNIKDTFDKGVNKAEYLKDRAEYNMDADDMMK